MKQFLIQYADVEENESLAKHTTFRVGGKARYLIYPKNHIALTRILDYLEEKRFAYRIFGKGSNLLCSDEDYDGIVICLDRYFSEFYFEEDGTCVVQSGCSLVLLAHEAMKKGLSGLEFASGIPGTVGGAIFMNAGAYLSDMNAIVESVYIYRHGKCLWVNKEELDFSYRHSIFQSNRDWIILGAKLKLAHGESGEIRELMDARRKRRMDTQPLNFPSAGSMFRNPENMQAWKLIEDLGLRGKMIGGAQVSEKHANFVINADHALAKDIMELVLLIQKKVKETYGVDLKMEVEKFNWTK